MSSATAMRVGAIDIGTNSIHLLIAEISRSGQITLIEKAREQVELGAGGMSAQRITPDAFERGVEALARFKQVCDTFQVDDVHAAATSAVREAANGADFCRAVKDRTGIHVRVVPGEQEARLIYLGVRADLDFSAGDVLLFDVGGGSTEFILADATRARVSCSTPLGHIRLADRFVPGETFGESEIRALRQEVRRVLTPTLARIPPGSFGTVVGTSGTVRALARMATLERGDVPPEHDQGLVLRRKELERLIKRFRTTPPTELGKIPGMDLRRRRTLPGGAVLVHEVLGLFGAESLVTSERSLRDGLIVDWVQRHAPEVQLLDTVADPRRRAILSVLERYAVERDHAEHTAWMAGLLFDATQTITGLTAEDRRTLEFGAMLHDIGHHISGKDHHKHAQYLIRHTPLPGFTQPEIEILGMLARYHRSGQPKKRHPEFAALPESDQRRVRVLSALLCFADGFDRGHARSVSRMEVELRRESLQVHAHTRDEGHLERWSAIQRKGALEEVLRRPIEVHLHPESDAIG